MISPAGQRDRLERGHALRPCSMADLTAFDGLVWQIQNYLECWKQIAHYLTLARAKKFDAEDESQFLELKAVIAQELELVLAICGSVSPTREDAHAMMNNVPSLRYLSQLSDGALRKLENEWHAIFIGWQATLGQLKVRHRQAESRPRRTGLWEYLPDLARKW
jgi:hypothetical protein